MEVYDGFDDKVDVFARFEEPLDEKVNIIFAKYDTPCYEGYAIVLAERDGNLFTVNGSHCSCYGLEGQWEECGVYNENVLRNMLVTEYSWERAVNPETAEEILDYCLTKYPHLRADPSENTD